MVHDMLVHLDEVGEGVVYVSSFRQEKAAAWTHVIEEEQLLVLQNSSTNDVSRHTFNKILYKLISCYAPVQPTAPIRLWSLLLASSCSLSHASLSFSPGNAAPRRRVKPEDSV